MGLEAALYARFLGYDVVMFERGRVCEHVQRLGHVRSFSPFGETSSPLALAAIEAQNEQYRAPEAGERLTGSEWYSRYLQPLAATDLLSDHLRLGTEVLSIGKEQVRKTDRNQDLPEGDERGDWSFRLLVRDPDGQERMEEADALLDCSGVLGQPNWCGQGGIPAVGERALRERIHYHLPDLLGDARELFAGRRTLLVGHGDSAVSAAVALHELQQQEPGTSFTWITRHEHQPAAGPVATSDDAPAPRLEMIQRANAIATQAGCWHWGTHVDRISREPDGTYRVSLVGQLQETEPFDQILALVGYRPDVTLLTELQIGLDAATEGLSDPLKELKQPEDNCYVLGAKSFGRRSGFRFSNGLEQIRELFSLLGDRESLNLYAGGKPRLNNP